MKRLVVLPLALVLALLLVLPAFAGAPVIEDGTWEDTYMVPYVQPCPDIEVWDHEVLTWHQTIYFDKQGNIESIKIHFLGTDTYFNPENPGVELTGKFSSTAEVDLQTGEYINGRGLPAHINVPGYGGVMMWAGFWTRYPGEHKAGLDTLSNPKDREAFCSFLGG